MRRAELQRYVRQVFNAMGIAGYEITFASPGRKPDYLADVEVTSNAHITLRLSADLLTMPATEVRRVVVHEGVHVLWWPYTAIILAAGDKGTRTKRMVTAAEELAVDRTARLIAPNVALPF